MRKSNVPLGVIFRIPLVIIYRRRPSQPKIWDGSWRVGPRRFTTQVFLAVSSDPDRRLATTLENSSIKARVPGSVRSIAVPQ